MAAVGVVLMPVCVLVAGWIITWALAGSMGPYGGVICAVTSVVIYLVTSQFLPKKALLDGAYLRWLAAAFGKSVGIAFRNAWIWAPAFAGLAVDVVSNLVWQLHNRASHPFEPQAFTLGHQSLWDSSHGYLNRAGPYLQHGFPWLLLYLGYFLFAARIGKWLQSASGLAPSRARRWHIVFMISASAGLLGTISLSLTHWAGLPAWLAQFVGLLDRGFFYFYFPVYCVSLPFNALVWTLFLTIVLCRLRGQPLSPDGVLKPAFIIIGPMVWLVLVVNGVCNAFLPLCQTFLAETSLGEWIRSCDSLLRLATVFLPVIIVSEQCGLRRACVRFGDFVRRHLWRYAAFIFLGALLLALPQWMLGKALGQAAGYWPVYLWASLASSAIRVAIQLGLIVMCFEFYLTRAGTFEPIDAEEVSSQVPSEGTR